MYKILLAITLICFSSIAFADDANPVIGKWAEKLPNGKMMVTEFTDNTIVAYPADESGKPVKAGTPAPIEYKKLDHDDKFGDGYLAQFKNPDGTISPGGVMVFIKDANTMTMDFPGMGAHTLTRIK